MSILNQVKISLGQSILRQPNLGEFSEDHSLILAVSGGPDSLCLLHLLCQGAFFSPENLIVAHLNHGLRKSAHDEAAFVKDFASNHNVRSIIKKCDVAALARNEGLSVEEAGRQARYHFFAGVAHDSGAKYVLTGHNADDQVETIVMHLLRGSAMTGLRGMQISSPLPDSPDLTLIRPLLQVRRSEIEAYCVEHDLVPVIDESNQDTTFYRNRLRHELFPLLDEYNPGIRERLQEMAIILNDDDSLLDELVGREWERLFIDKGSGWLTLDRMGWHSTPIGLQRRLVRKAIHTLLPNLRNVGFRTTEQAREVASGAHVGSKSSLPAGLSLSIGYDDLLFSVEDAAVPIQNLPQLKNIGVFDLPVPGRLTLGNGWIIQAQMLEGVNLRRVLENQDPWQAFVSVANPKGIIVRARRLGERFQPLGMSGGSTKVSRVMIDQKMPKRLRTKWPIVASHDHLLWLVGYHIDERASIGVESKKVLFLQAHKEVDA